MRLYIKQINKGHKVMGSKEVSVDLVGVRGKLSEYDQNMLYEILKESINPTAPA